jgi:hypothetical protein
MTYSLIYHYRPSAYIGRNTFLLIRYVDGIIFEVPEVSSLDLLILHLIGSQQKEREKEYCLVFLNKTEEECR